MFTIYKGTPPKIPFTIKVKDCSWGYSQIAIHIEGILDCNGEPKRMALHTSVREGQDWRPIVRDTMSAAHQALWQVHGSLHHNAKLTEAVKDAFQLGYYKQVKEEENANA